MTPSRSPSTQCTKAVRVGEAGHRRLEHPHLRIPAQGKPLELLELARAGQVELGVSDAILDETARVLKDKFHVPEEDVRDLRQELLGFAKHVTPAEALDAVPRDDTDNRILECAVAAGSGTVVTGDQHLLSLGNFRGIRFSGSESSWPGIRRGDEGQNP
jgi:putative PIN family toxin of toxin-antitoxin system